MISEPSLDDRATVARAGLRTGPPIGRDAGVDTPPREHHAPGGTDGHAHTDHAHADHAHAHAGHGPAAAARREQGRSIRIRPSLMRFGVAMRLSLSALVVLAIWASTLSVIA